MRDDPLIATPHQGVSAQVKRLLCISPLGSTAVRAHCGALQGWDVCIVDSLAAASQVLREQRFAVGLLLDCVGRVRCDELAQFLRQQWRVRWAGVFDPHILDDPACRTIVADHLYDFHTCPVDQHRLYTTLGHAHGLAVLRERVAAAAWSGQQHLSAGSPAMDRLRQHIGKIARVEAPVVISGESGSGKELAAQAIHGQSRRGEGPFIAINCGAIPASLIQSELFGYERGAFSGANKSKEGLIEAASGGSIFLDEVAELPLESQSTLLRFLQEKTIFRLGSTRSIRVDARVIAASHVDLQAAVAKGLFREDLYYRLSVFQVQVPPLRARKEDLPLLAEEIFDQFAAEKSARLEGFSVEALRALGQYDWPGNVRELINRIRRAMVLAEGAFITPEDLGLAEPQAQHAPDQLPPALGEIRMHSEKAALCNTLQRCNGNITRAARDMGVSRMTVYRLLAKHGVTA